MHECTQELPVLGEHGYLEISNEHQDTGATSGPRGASLGQHLRGSGPEAFHAHGVQGVSKRSTVFRIALIWKLAACDHFSVLYSTLKTASPDDVQPARPGAGKSHSRYWKHCSLIAKSNQGFRSLACPRSFFNPTVSPFEWARFASEVSKSSWVSELIVRPVLFW